MNLGGGVLEVPQSPAFPLANSGSAQYEGSFWIRERNAKRLPFFAGHARSSRTTKEVHPFCPLALEIRSTPVQKSPHDCVDLMCWISFSDHTSPHLSRYVHHRPNESQNLRFVPSPNLMTRFQHRRPVSRARSCRHRRRSEPVLLRPLSSR